MATCERCGTEIPEQVTICPSCGTPISGTKTSFEGETQQPSEPQKEPHNLFPGSAFAEYAEYTPQPRTVYERNYAAQPTARESDTSKESEPPSQTPETEPASTASHAYQPSQPSTFSLRIFNTNLTTPVLIEALLSLVLGIYGVGWLLAGEIPTGILLLLASFIIYLPLVIISFIFATFTFGLSMLCTGPLAISAILFNVSMLNRAIKRKRARYTMAQPR